MQKGLSSRRLWCYVRLLPYVVHRCRASAVMAKWYIGLSVFLCSVRLSISSRLLHTTLISVFLLYAGISRRRGNFVIGDKRCTPLCSGMAGLSFYYVINAPARFLSFLYPCVIDSPALSCSCGSVYATGFTGGSACARLLAGR